MSDKIWYPFTQMTDIPNDSFIKFVKGDGNYLYDDEGNKYLDAYSSLWVNLHGHNHPKIIEAITNQAKLLDHSTLLGATNGPAVSLAERLCDLVPIDNGHVFYSDSGSTSVEIGCKIAYQYFQNIGEKSKTKFLSLKNAYHGDTLGMVGLGGIDLFHSIFHPILNPSLKTLPPYEHLEQKLDGALKELEGLLDKEGQNIAAFVVEPILQGAAGMLKIRDGYLKGIRRLCDEYNVLLVVDEVATGFGRTGKLFASEHEDVKPDIICLAKGISGGVLPLAATIASDKIYKSFLGKYEEFKAFFHGHSYTGNPIACAAALASLDIFENENVMGHVEEIEKIFDSSMKDVAKHPNVISVRYKGIMGGIEIGQADGTEFAIEKRIGHQVCVECIKKGVYLRPLANVIALVPPLSITKEELSKTFDVIKESLNNVLNLVGTNEIN